MGVLRRPHIGPHSSIRTPNKAFTGGAGAFTPTQLPGLSVWYKADAGTSTTTDGVAISQWNDQSGNGRDLTQATGGQQPLYKAAIQNGLPVVRFDGINDFFSTVAWTPGASVSAFVVVRPASTTGNQHILVHAGGATWVSPFAQYVIRTNAATAWQAWRDSGAASTFTGGTISTTNFKVVEITAGATVDTETLFEDRVAVAGPLGGTPQAASSQVFVVGGHQGAIGSNESFNGDIGEVLVYNSLLSTTDRQSVENYLRTRWATA